MMRHIPRHPEPRNGGSTLTEVLISTMVLAIGVISVGTLFPLSLARAIRANQITQSTIHRYNCEGLIEALKLNNYWMFVVEPGLDSQALTNYDNHFPGEIGDDDLDGSPNINLGLGVNGFTLGIDLLPGVAGRDDDGYGVDDDGDTMIDEPDEVDDILEVGWSDPVYNYISDDRPIMDEDELQFGGFDTQKVIIDPLGWHRMSAGYLGAGTTYQNNFGGDAYWGAKFATVGSTVIPRLNGGYFGNNQWLNTNSAARPYFWLDRDGAGDPNELPNGGASGGYGFTEAQAEELVTLQDQYASAIDTPFADIGNIGAITTRARLDLANAKLSAQDLIDINSAMLSGLKVRAVFFGLKGAANPVAWNESRFLIHPSDPSIVTPPPIQPAEIFWAPSEALPAEFQIERVVLQIQNLDFTWMITARLTAPPPTRPQIDVVIFHKRRFEAEDEDLFIATQSVGNLNQVTIDISSGPKPNAKKGSWMFDVEHCFWYQIANLQETTSTMTLTLEHRIRDRRDSATDNLSTIAVAFPRGIVDVFPIGTK